MHEGGIAMNGQCSGRNCEVASTCARFNPKLHADALCEFAGNEHGPAVWWAQRIQVETLKRAA